MRLLLGFQVDTQQCGQAGWRWPMNIGIVLEAATTHAPKSLALNVEKVVFVMGYLLVCLVLMVG